MKNNLLKSLLISATAGSLISCNNGSNGTSQIGTNQNSITQTTTVTCSGIQTWDSAIAYDTGSYVIYNEIEYQSSFWTQNNNPATNNGPSNSGEPWIVIGACNRSVNSTPTPSSTASPQPTPINVITGAAKIKATYWAMWGGNTSYDLTGGSYKSTPVDAENINSAYNVIIASFIITDTNGNYTLATYDPGSQIPVYYYTDQQIINMVQQVKSQGRKIIVSIGGQYFTLKMATAQDKNFFESQLKGIINKFGFEGIDLDLEGGATGANPTLLAQAVTNVVDYYRSQGQDFWLTMAPEWGYVVPYGYGCGQYGSHSYQNLFYVQLINAIGMDNISYIWPQTYNQGSSNGVCGNNQNSINPGSGMDNFVSALAWAATTESGYSVNTSGMAAPLMPIIPASKFVIGIPATLGAAGGGMTYIMTPTLINNSWNIMKNIYGFIPAGYMDWAADWDATPYTNTAYSFTHFAWQTGLTMSALQ